MKRFLLLLAIFSGCTPFQNHYNPPANVATAYWKNQEADLDNLDCEQIELNGWWELFNDSHLTNYAKTLVRNNPTARSAYHRMAQAYFISKSTFSDLFPFVTFDPSFFRQGSKLFTGALNNVPAPLSPQRLIVSQDILPLNFNWEIDVWGKLTQTYLNTYFSYQSEYFEYASTMNQLTADLAVNYFMMRGYDSEIKILDQFIVSRQDNLDLNQSRYETGLSSYLDVSRAEVDLTAAQSERENVVRQRQIQENIVATLQGVPASDFQAEFTPLHELSRPPKISPYLPCELIYRRPDIQAAERMIAAMHANMGVAYSRFFPSFTLGGAIGYASTSLDTLLNWQSRLWQEAINISQVVFDSGKLKAQLNVTKEAYYQAISTFEEAVLRGIKDVEDALFNLRQRKIQEEFIFKTFKAAEDTYFLAKDQYLSGISDYLIVTIAERDFLNAARSLTNVRSQQFVDTALLIKALGGGW